MRKSSPSKIPQTSKLKTSPIIKKTKEKSKNQNFSSKIQSNSTNFLFLGDEEANNKQSLLKKQYRIFESNSSDKILIDINETSKINKKTFRFQILPKLEKFGILVGETLSDNYDIVYDDPEDIGTSKNSFVFTVKEAPHSSSSSPQKKKKDVKPAQDSYDENELRVLKRKSIQLHKHMGTLFREIEILSTSDHPNIMKAEKIFFEVEKGSQICTINYLMPYFQNNFLSWLFKESDISDMIDEELELSPLHISSDAAFFNNSASSPTHKHIGFSDSPPSIPGPFAALIQNKNLNLNSKRSSYSGQSPRTGASGASTHRKSLPLKKDFSPSSVLKRYNKRMFEEVREFLVGLLQGIDYIHNRGFVHLAINFENLMVDVNDQCMIGGFDVHQFLEKQNTEKIEQETEKKGKIMSLFNGSPENSSSSSNSSSMTQNPIIIPKVKMSLGIIEQENQTPQSVLQNLNDCQQFLPPDVTKNMIKSIIKDSDPTDVHFNNQFSKKIDIYSFGIILYRLFVDDYPTSSRNSMDLNNIKSSPSKDYQNSIEISNISFENIKKRIQDMFFKSNLLLSNPPNANLNSMSTPNSRSGTPTHLLNGSAPTPFGFGYFGQSMYGAPAARPASEFPNDAMISDLASIIKSCVSKSADERPYTVQLLKEHIFFKNNQTD